VEKISGIVPTSHRVSSVNLKDSQTMRPGVPTFGANVGKAAINGGSQPTTAEKAVAAHNELMARRSGDAHKPALIRDMMDRFFMKNMSESQAPIDDVDINFNMDKISSVGPSIVSDMQDPSTQLSANPVDASSSDVTETEWIIADDSGEYDDYTPPGSYIDVKV